MVIRQRGFTLIELMIVIVILGLLALVAGPYTTGWVNEAAVNDGESLLHRAHSQAKAVAMRNPTEALGDAVAASVKLTGNVLLVCEGAPGAAACTDGGAAMVWRATWPAGVQLNLTEITINNRGQVVIGGTPVNGGLTYSLSKGSVTDNDTAHNRLR